MLASRPITGQTGSRRLSRNALYAFMNNENKKKKVTIESVPFLDEMDGGRPGGRSVGRSSDRRAPLAVKRLQIPADSSGFLAACPVYYSNRSGKERHRRAHQQQCIPILCAVRNIVAIA